MRNLSELVRGGTFCLSKAGVGVGSTSTQIKIAAPNGAGVDYCIGGKMYHKADAASAAGSACAQQAVSTKCLYLICLSTAGAITFKKGDEKLTADLSAGDAVLEWPMPEDGVCPIGGFMIETNASATFTAATTAFDATGITDTFYDFFSVPGEVVTS